MKIIGGKVMSELKEKVAYLRGMSNGLKLSDEKDQGKMINAIIDTLNDFADEFDRLEAMHMSMQEQVNVIDEDLGNLEDEIYENEYDDDFIEVVCPHCDKDITFVEGEIENEEEVECPFCGKTFEIEWEYEEDCGCGCDDCKDK